MTDSRTPGRYNLTRLGFAAFEDLCTQIMRHVLGETCTRYLPGRDGGRDAWFQGKCSGKLQTQDQLSGDFLVQYKHTSIPQTALSLASLKKEVEKVKKFSANQPLNYLLLTNLKVSAEAERKIREAFEALSGVKRCLVRGETWIEDTIDATPKLLRLVPRLYGIGDLSQIVSFSLREQTRAILEDWAAAQKTFVPTESYRRTEKAISEHGLAVVVGPAAAGKSSIAASLCITMMAQEESCSVLKIGDLREFNASWSPADSHTVYWVDDIFGETTLDEERVKEWSLAFEKLDAALRRGVKVIFCTRDYIFSAAEDLVKRDKFERLLDSEVRITVSESSKEERETILYNHIKDGNLSRAEKLKLKPFLKELANLSSFTPELARRLGSSRFHVGLKYERESLKAFFERPVDYFRQVAHGLGAAEKAALTTCLLNNNAVPDPIPDAALHKIALDSYGVTAQQVRNAFDSLEGSLVKKVVSGVRSTWQVHHPTMIEALQLELSSGSSLLLLYITAATLKSLLRDTTTISGKGRAGVVFLPADSYFHLIERLAGVGEESLYSVAGYLVQRSSDSLLEEIQGRKPELIDRALSIESLPDQYDYSARLAVRLGGCGAGHLLTESRKEMVKKAIKNGFVDHGWLGALDPLLSEQKLSDVAEEILKTDLASQFSSLERLCDWYLAGENSRANIEAASSAIGSQYKLILDGLSRLQMLTEEAPAVLEAIYNEVQQKLQQRLELIEEEESRRADMDYDAWKEARFDRDENVDCSRFDDVEE